MIPAPRPATPLVPRIDPDAAAVRAAQRDRRAFEVLYRRYVDRVYAHAFYALGDHHDAEDATERTFLDAMKGIGAYRDTGAGFRAWLFRVCTNIVRDHARRIATEDRNPVMPERPTPEPPDVAYERAETVRIVRSALERLSPRDREALLLRESGFRYAEIAEVIGVRTEIVPTLIARAMRRLQKSYRMEGRDVASA